MIATSGSTVTPGLLAARLRRFIGMAKVHHRTEERLLRPIVPTIDAWGSLRAAHMDRLHNTDHADIEAQATAALAAVESPFACAEVLALVGKVRRHMAEEEGDYLNPTVLRDDVVTLGQSDG